jgi:hypothetical protein
MDENDDLCTLYSRKKTQRCDISRWVKRLRLMRWWLRLFPAMMAGEDLRRSWPMSRLSGFAKSSTRRFSHECINHASLAQIAVPAMRRSALWLVVQVIRFEPAPRPIPTMHLGFTSQDDLFGSKKQAARHESGPSHIANTSRPDLGARSSS